MRYALPDVTLNAIDHIPPEDCAGLAEAWGSMACWHVIRGAILGRLGVSSEQLAVTAAECARRAWRAGNRALGA